MSTGLYFTRDFVFTYHSSNSASSGVYSRFLFPSLFWILDETYLTLWLINTYYILLQLVLYNRLYLYFQLNIYLPLHIIKIVINVNKITIQLFYKVKMGLVNWWYSFGELIRRYNYTTSISLHFKMYRYWYFFGRRVK